MSELMAWWEANGVHFVFGLAKNDPRNIESEQYLLRFWSATLLPAIQENHVSQVLQPTDGAQIGLAGGNSAYSSTPTLPKCF